MSLGEFIRRYRDEILVRWLEAVRALPATTGQPTSVLRDHMPQIVEQLAAELLEGEALERMQRLTGQHAVLRYRAGYDLRQMLLEYQALRQVIHELHVHVAPGETASAVWFAGLDRFLDEAIGDAVVQYKDEHDRTRDVFVAVLGHDLRNPLQTILSSAGVLRREGLGEPARSAVALIETSGWRMSRMISDLLDFARARLGGEIPLARAVHDLLHVVRTAVGEMGATHPTRRLVFRTEPATGNLRARFDADRVVQALSNLLSNAVEHGEDPIVVVLRDEGERLAIEVRNRGTIAEDARSVLFEPFRKSGTSEGLGLGLYVVREIARAHGGEVTATSEGGETTFRLVLPRTAEAEAA